MRDVGSVLSTYPLIHLEGFLSLEIAPWKPPDCLPKQTPDIALSERKENKTEETCYSVASLDAQFLAVMGSVLNVINTVFCIV